ncbi:MAG: BolA/IbaG family iron-sulfur metabolism protein [Planctomycetes bacterium]|nr:BolA/IbaG family iron-sulfur metabolism protein [Planctomycetota bacterium]
MLSTQDVRALVERAIPGARVEVTDLTGTSDHFHILAVSDAFEGRSTMERHRMIHRALGEHLTRAIHAVDIKTRTPAEL